MEWYGFGVIRGYKRVFKVCFGFYIYNLSWEEYGFYSVQFKESEDRRGIDWNLIINLEIIYGLKLSFF